MNDDVLALLKLGARPKVKDLAEYEASVLEHINTRWELLKNGTPLQFLNRKYAQCGKITSVRNVCISLCERGELTLESVGSHILLFPVMPWKEFHKMHIKDADWLEVQKRDIFRASLQNTGCKVPPSLQD